LPGADCDRRGKKLPELEALEMCFRAIDQGASGVDMGRNIFQSSAPLAMLKAVKKVVHENMSAREAYQFWQEEKQGEQNECDAGGDQHQAGQDG
jgi:putative autoinducer-2 (AI-2) aldolase